MGFEPMVREHFHFQDGYLKPLSHTPKYPLLDLNQHSYKEIDFKSTTSTDSVKRALRTMEIMRFELIALCMQNTYSTN